MYILCYGQPFQQSMDTLRYIAYTEQRENHGTMILDRACYSAYTVL